MVWAYAESIHAVIVAVIPSSDAQGCGTLEDGVGIRLSDAQVFNLCNVCKDGTYR
jgi:hypothetical protein